MVTIGSRTLKRTNLFVNMFLIFIQFLICIITQPMLAKSDVGYSWQFGFQDPSSEIMESLINLHHDIMFFLILIVVKIIILLFILLNTNPQINSFFKAAVEFSHLKDSKLSC